MVKRKFIITPKAPVKRFKKFKILTKTKLGLQRYVFKNDALKRTIKTIFSKKALGTAAVGGAIAAGVASIWNYIESNSGCFRKQSDGSVCKFRELSCCQKDPLDNINFCEQVDPKLVNACDNFDEDEEKSCCRLCDCNQVDCLPDETLTCQRPTVAEALNHFASQMSSTVFSGIDAIFPWLKYILYGIAVLLIFWTVKTVLPILRFSKQDV